MIFKKGELKLLWPFYLDAVISPLFFFMPAFMVLYFNGIGLSLFQIGILMGVANLTSLLFEIPTGAIADLYGRKFSVLLSYFLQGAGFLSLFFVKEYYLIVGVYAFLGIASTFSSGAKEAWVIDLIRTSRKDFQKGYFVKSQAIDSAGLILSGIIGAYAVKLFGLSIIWVATGVSFFAAFAIGLCAHERFVRKRTADSSIQRITKQGWKAILYSKNHSVLFSFLIAAAFLILASNLTGQIAWLPFFKELGLPEYAFGYLWSFMAVMGVVAPLLVSRLLKTSKERAFILTSVLLLSFVTLLIFFVNSVAFAIILLLVSTLFWGMRFTAERIYFHRFIPSKLRASVGSLESMVLSVTAIVGAPLAGWLVDNIGPRYTIVSAAAIMLIAALIYYRIKEDKKRLFSAKTLPTKPF
ncbi:MAG TPA: MFS transporter [Candidatus Nanoarchaeia archaeon]|nr:MFS transporter [Candidatus Nanoarchaeia archaeon]